MASTEALLASTGALLALPDGRLYHFAGDRVSCQHLDGVNGGRSGGEERFGGHDEGAVPGDGRGVPITAAFPGLFPGGVDASLLHPDGTVTFFSGRHHMRYDVRARRPLRGYPRPYGPDWPGVPPDHVDGALAWAPDVVYLFTGPAYVSFSPRRGAVRRGFPKPIAANWPALGHGPVRAATTLPDGRHAIVTSEGAHVLDRVGETLAAGEPDLATALLQRAGGAIAHQAPPKPAAPPPSPPAPPPAAVRTLPLGVDLAAERADAAAFGNLKQRGKVFAIIKASQGRTPNNPSFPRYYGYAADAGLLRGSYHFLSNRHSRHPLFGGTIAEQADTLLAQVARLAPGDLAPALDIEDQDPYPLNEARAPVDPQDPTGYRYRPEYVKGQAQNANWRQGRDQLLDDIQTFLDRIETALGRTPLVYTSRTWTDSDQMQNPRRFAQYPLWFLDHYCDPPRLLQHLGIATIGAWGTDYTLLQYAEQKRGHRWCGRDPYKEPGIDIEGVDFDAYNGTLDGLRGLADLGRPTIVADRGLLGGRRFVAHADADGGIHLATGSAGRWTSRRLADPTRSNPDLEGGDPFLVTQSGMLFAYYRSQRHVIEATLQPLRSTTWQTRRIEDVVAAVHDPRAVVHGTRRHVVYWGEDDDWHVMTIDGATVTNLGTVLSRAGVRTGARRGHATGQPVPYLHEHRCHVVGRAGFEGHLVDVWPDGGAFRHADLTALARAQDASTPPATYSPCVYDAGAGAVVVFRGVRGELWTIDRRTGRPTNVSRSIGPQAPLVAGHPACFVLGGVPHVVVRGIDKRIHDVYLEAGSWRARPICDEKAAADPSAIADGPVGVVAIRLMDGTVHQAVLDVGAWTCTPTVTRSEAAPSEAAVAEGRFDERPDEPQEAPTVEHFGGGEHRAIGDAGSKRALTALAYGPAATPLTFGEVVALAADYYESYYDLHELSRTDAGRAELAWARWDCLELPGGQEPPADAATKKRVRDRYFLLASQNVPHFSAGGTATEHYMRWHSAAMVSAIEAGQRGDAGVWKTAVGKEAFAGHYLTDMFSAGHVRTPRAAIKEWYAAHLPGSSEQLVRYMARYMYDRLDERGRIPAFVEFLTWFTGLGPARIADRIRLLGGEAIRTFSLGDIVSLGLHDRDNHGLMVVSRADEHGARPAGGHRWRAVGDDHLTSATHRAPRVVPAGWTAAQVDEAAAATTRMAVAAVAASLRDVERVRDAARSTGPLSGPETVAFLKRTLGGQLFPALDYVPHEDTSAPNVPLVVAQGRSPLEWRWGQLGDEAFRAVDTAVRHRVAPSLAAMVNQVADPTTVKQWGIEITIHGTRPAFTRFVQHLATDGIAAIERAVGKPAH